MPAIFGRLPVRVSVGDGKPQDIGVWEITGKGENGQLTISTAAFAEVLREAANNLAPDPALSAAYRERARLVAYLATQHPAVLAYADPDEPEWAVVYVHTPAGQMSWHIAPGDVELFAHVPKVTPDSPLAQWDGHDTPTKYERLAHMTRFMAMANDQRGR
jgi:hypothetical protein